MAGRRPGAQEVAEIKEMFKRHDVDTDGAINQSEFKAMLTRLGILLSPSDELKLFKQIDIDESGKIEVGEFIDHYRTIIELEKQSELKRLQELQSKTTFSLDELKAMYANFKRIATTHNDDGLIDKMEFRQMMLDSQMDTERNMVFYDGLFRMFDKDGSGDIDFNEFVLAIAVYYGKMPSQTMEERMRFFFTIYDVDGDGVISPNDVKKVLHDCMNANHVGMDEALVEQIVKDTFARFGAAQGFDFNTFKGVYTKKQSGK